MYTKEKLRPVAQDMVRSNRAAGVPDDGIAELFLQWTVALMQSAFEEGRAKGQEEMHISWLRQQQQKG